MNVWRNPGVLAGLGATLLFGAGTPAAKLLLGPVSPWLLAGLLAIALTLGAALPTPEVLLAAGAVGFFSYGLSLVLFVLALRHLGTARTGAYFSTAPFAGALIAIPLLGEIVTATLVIAGLLMGAGVWLPTHAFASS